MLPSKCLWSVGTHLGDAVTKCGQLVADGKIGAKDRPVLPAAIETLRFVDSCSFEIRCGIENELSAHSESEPHALV